MTPSDATLDQRARSLHQASLQRLSPRVQAQLAQRRRALGDAPRRAGRFMPWAGAATAAVALAFALQLRPPSATDAPGSGTSQPVAVDDRVAMLDASATDGDPAAVLAEDPEFYLWLVDSGQTEQE